MADQTPRYRSYDTDIDIHDNVEWRLTSSHKPARTDSHPEEPVPLFLSDYDGEPDPSEYMAPLRKDRRLSVSSRILAGVLAIAADGNWIRDVFFGCHTRHRRQRQGFNCGRPSGSLRSGAA